MVIAPLFAHFVHTLHHLTYLTMKNKYVQVQNM